MGEVSNADGERGRGLGRVGGVLLLDPATYLQIVAHAYDELPFEMCGLFAGSPPPADDGSGSAGGRVRRFHACANAARSARVYEVDPRDHLRADREAEEQGGRSSAWSTPTPTPRPTPRPSTWPGARSGLALRHRFAGRRGPSLRSWRIRDGNGTEEAVVVSDWLDCLSE